MHVSDDELGISRHAYENAKDEKMARGGLSSAIKRTLDRDTIVVADAMNYIKGFRYQLYCEAKAVRTNSCVVCFHYARVFPWSTQQGKSANA